MKTLFWLLLYRTLVLANERKWKGGGRSVYNTHQLGWQWHQLTWLDDGSVVSPQQRIFIRTAAEAGAEGAEKAGAEEAETEGAGAGAGTKADGVAWNEA